MSSPFLPTTPPTAADSAFDVREVTAAKVVADTVLLLMGVSGCGKTTIALELQRLLGWPFKEGDDLHPVTNVEKMRSGRPLDDEDRRPWLMAVAGWIDERLTVGEPGIITCSNLKHAYRKITVGDRTGVTVIYLQVEERLIVDRVSRRKHRFMPPSLLHSQFETLEEPTADEHAIVVPAGGTVADTVIDLLRKVAAFQHAGSGDGASRS